MTAAVLTFTIQTGTSGVAVAQLVASRMGYAYLDKEILIGAAQLGGLSVKAFAAAERWPGLSERILQGLCVARRDDHPYPAAPGVDDGDAFCSLDPRLFRFFIDRVVIEAAHSGGCVIVGHAAQATLGGRGPGVCSVLLHGSLEARATQVARAQGITADEALSELRRQDREQAEYLKHAYQVDWLDPSLYQLMLNIDSLPDASAAELIVELAASTYPSSTAGTPRRTSSNGMPVGIEASGRMAPSLSLA
jgi:cytidylate kinase